MKTLRRLLLYIALPLATLLVAFIAAVFMYKDRLIQEFIREANQYLNTPVTIEKIDLDLWESFPNLSIVFEKVYIEDSHAGQYPLGTAARISFQLNPLEAWRGKYTIKSLYIRDSETTLKVNAQGVNNYTVLKKTDSTKEQTINFELNNVHLINTSFRFVNQKENQEYSFSGEELKAHIRKTGNVYSFSSEGDVHVNTIAIGEHALFNGKTFQVNSDLTYDESNALLTVLPSRIQLNRSPFTFSGTYQWKSGDMVDFDFQSKDTDIQALLSLLPEKVSKPLEKYRSKGNVFFNARLKGKVSRTTKPSFTASFGFDNATLYHPDYKATVEEASMKGSFSAGDISDPSQSILHIKDIEGKLNGMVFTANLKMENFSDPVVSLDFKGNLDASSLLGFYPVPQIKEISGTLKVDISFQGRLSLLKRKATAQQTSATGSIEVHDMNFLAGSSHTPVKGLNGVLQFNNNDLALSNVTVHFGNSDMLFNGFFKNVITFLLFEGQPIGIETDLTSSFLDLDELFAIGFGGNDSPENKGTYTFGISKNINLNFNCDIGALRYKKFHAQHIEGDLLVKNQVAVSRGLRLKTMGGTMALSGIVDAKNPKAIDVVASAEFKGLYIDSLFYVFENFRQSFVTDKNLKGQAFSTVNAEMVLGPDLRMFSETLIADIGITIQKGELNQFEPLKKLDKYLDDRNLGRIRFSDIRNDIHIENKTIYIPQMDVRTNVTDMRISGTHTFDQFIDYHIVTPLRSKKNIDENEAQGALSEDGTGQTKLYLKITGTTDNYHIQYDTDAVKKKIVSGLKNEVKELKDAFRNKTNKKKKELELSDEEFDW